ncbi:hypothetical protein O6H91_20G064400 [Diphasiastrum complanatum]|uniref:Uncharacterized protein n=3 Tax=Diphasiastrum complanatum TaxID=34168 RepID=A0ACC2APW5_DIPCM|nr:hypothetical protein O6H91_20G041400 [Diphasiastrum complanatum]KAJ7519496.1 hypothetical protein O6H91_20G041400 [Diphasiastrum complanatum]KAJ7520038.1 hypothetical protein O6H91_20G064400 [Diphasiastrum complanatum]
MSSPSRSSMGCEELSTKVAPVAEIDHKTPQFDQQVKGCTKESCSSSDVARARLLAISQVEPNSIATSNKIFLPQTHNKISKTNDEEEEYRLKLMVISTIDSTSIAGSTIKTS